MADFFLPKNSRVVKGVEHNEHKDGTKRINVYRFDPDKNSNPMLDTFYLTKPQCGNMLLDALIEIKVMDPTFTFRRSCREGICGSCSMNVNGQNTLACVKHVDELKGDISVYPLPHMPVIKDLVTDLTVFYKHYNSIEPWMKSSRPKPAREHLQSIEDRKRLDPMSDCILCACCTTSCPSFWWNGESYLGPAALLQAHRWLEDSRDDAKHERLDFLEDSFRLFRCHNITNCAHVCPKGLNPTESISKIRQMLLDRESSSAV